MNGISELLNDLNLFNNSYTPKVLDFLIRNSGNFSAKQICSELKYPDSKIYPALKELEELNLISKFTHKRPYRYWLPDITKINHHLKEAFNEKIRQQKEMIEDIIELIVNIWEPRDYLQEDIAKILKSDNINYEIINLLKLAQEQILIILSPSGEKYIDAIERGLDHTMKSVAMRFAHPNSINFHTIQKTLSKHDFDKVQLKLSTSSNHSYIVIDNKIMLDIIHNKVTNVGLITNNSLIVEYINSCWNNQFCCVAS
jgi:DNA-binding transcriptional regulator GbsR (MarR family)